MSGSFQICTCPHFFFHSLIHFAFPGAYAYGQGQTDTSQHQLWSSQNYPGYRPTEQRRGKEAETKLTNKLEPNEESLEYHDPSENVETGSMNTAAAEFVPGAGVPTAGAGAAEGEGSMVEITQGGARLSPSRGAYERTRAHTIVHTQKKREDVDIVLFGLSPSKQGPPIICRRWTCVSAGLKTPQLWNGHRLLLAMHVLRHVFIH